MPTRDPRPMLILMITLSLMGLIILGIYVSSNETLDKEKVIVQENQPNKEKPTQQQQQQNQQQQAVEPPIVEPVEPPKPIDPREMRDIKGLATNEDTSKITESKTEKDKGRLGFIFVSYTKSADSTTTEEKSVTKKFYNLYIRRTEGFSLQQIPEEWVEIVETDKIEPSIKGRFTANGKICSDFIEEYPYIIYVPVGTLAFEYEINLIKESE